MFASPLYLFALAGLAVPVAIHLLSRKEGKIIRIGSIRHVVETSTQQFRGIRLNEILLLLLRCAMIIVLSLLLGGLQLFSSKKEKWVLVERGLEKLPALNKMLDSLQKEKYKAHWLSEGFPRWSDSSHIHTEINYWRLAGQLKSKELSDVIVFAQNKISQFKGERVGLPENIRWINQTLEAKEFTVSATQLKHDSILVREGRSDASQTIFISRKIPVGSSSFPVSPPDTIRLLLVADAEFLPDQQIVRASLKAIENSIPIRIELTENGREKFDSKNFDGVIWLSTERPQAEFAKVIYFNQQSSNELINQVEPNKWIITKRLDEGVALHENLTLQLASLLVSEQKDQAIVNVNDQRALSDSVAWNSKRYLKSEVSVSNGSADQYLLLLLVVLLLIERIIAYRKNQ